MEVRERRRLAVAAAFTVVALPSLWLLEHDDPSAATPSVAAAGLPTPDGGGGGDSPVQTFEQPDVPVFLDDTIVVGRPAVIDIARPDAPSENEAAGIATFRRYEDAVVDRPCSTPLTRAGVTITITNVDNGLSTTCTNTLGYVIPVGADIAIDTDVFVTIADLVDAPVPVRLSW